MSISTAFCFHQPNSTFGILFPAQNASSLSHLANWSSVMKPTHLQFSPIFSSHFDHHKSFLCDHVNSQSHDPSLRTTSPSLTRNPSFVMQFAYSLFPLQDPLLPLVSLPYTLAYSPFPLHNPLSHLVIFPIHSLTHRSHSTTHSLT